MNPPSLVCVGEVLVDLVPDASGGSYAPRLGGAPANVAVMAAALGTPSALVSRVGDDWLGRLVTQRLAGTGIDTRMVRVLGAPTGLAVVAPEGEGPPDFLMYRNGSADSRIRLDAEELSAVGSAHVVHLSSLLPTSPEGRTCVEQVLDVRRRVGGLVSYDVNLRPTAWQDTEEMRAWARTLIGGADVVKVTESELDHLGITLGERHEDVLWLVTDGPNGARLVGPHGQVAVTAPEVPVVDTTGAGDAALACVLASLTRSGSDPLGLALDDARRLVGRAVEIGSRVVQHAGATAWLEGVVP